MSTLPSCHRIPTDRNMKPILLVYSLILAVDWNQQIELYYPVGVCVFGGLSYFPLLFLHTPTR